MATNPVPTKSLSAARVIEVIGTVTGVITEIERLISASGLGGMFDVTQVGQLTALFGNLAGVAIQAAHDVFGKPISPDSVLALMPTATALVDPRNESVPAS